MQMRGYLPYYTKKKRKIYLQNKNSTMYRLLTWVYINFIVPNKSCFINTDAKRRMRVCLFCSREYGLAIMINTYLAVKGLFFLIQGDGMYVNSTFRSNAKPGRQDDLTYYDDWRFELLLNSIGPQMSEKISYRNYVW